MINIIKLVDPLDPGLKDIILELQKEHKEVEGINELYDELLALGKCESYSLDRIHYVSNTLAAKDINFNLRT